MLLKSIFDLVKKGVGGIKNSFLGIKDFLFSRKVIDEEFISELEDKLISWDLGVEMVSYFMNEIRTRAKKRLIKEPAEVLPMLKELLISNLQSENFKINYSPEGCLSIIMVVGINGTGKTTSVAKLANYFKTKGKSVMVVAGDTFRAGAIEQLSIWCKKLDVELLSHQYGADPGAVVFDGITSALAKKKDVLIIDVAGRVHTEKNLMEELRKIVRIINKKISRPPNEVILTIDATVGQNGLSQAKVFKEATDVTGVFLTKLDGTAKGGIIFSIKKHLNIPVKFIGFGETLDDIAEFNPEEYVKALFE